MPTSRTPEEAILFKLALDKVTIDPSTYIQLFGESPFQKILRQPKKAPPPLAPWWRRAVCALRGHGERQQIHSHKEFWLHVSVHICMRCGARVQRG